MTEETVKYLGIKTNSLDPLDAKCVAILHFGHSYRPVMWDIDMVTQVIIGKLRHSEHIPQALLDAEADLKDPDRPNALMYSQEVSNG